MKFPIVWVSDNVPQIEDTEVFVLPELEQVFQNLDRAEDLIFHTIFVGTTFDGPIVMAYGKENDPNIYLDYLDDVQWIRMTDD
jgi:hypothetical protein